MARKDNCLSDEEALKAFLLDIDCLTPLNEWTSKFNLFDILKISRAEIRHSNMLAWLLNSDESHGLGDRVLRGLIQHVVSNEQTQKYDVFSTLLMDMHSFVLHREWQNIDILAISDKEHFVLCIQNKIDTREHDDQLNRYRTIIDQMYPSYQKMFIYLTPRGIQSSDENNWISVSYEIILDIITAATQQVELLPDAAMLIRNYTETVRRDIVGDERLARICEQIYAKHGKALDLIFEHKPDRTSMIAHIIQDWCLKKQEEGLLTMDINKCSNTYTRFKTPFMSSVMPDAEVAASGWNTKNHYYYEIVNRNGEQINIQFAVSGQNIPDALRKVCDRINELYPAKRKKEDWLWRTHFSTKSIKIDADTPEEKLIEMLNKRLDEVFAFEKQLREKL